MISRLTPVLLAVAAAGACSKPAADGVHSSDIVGSWGLSKVDGLDPAGSVTLDGSDQGLRLSGCGEMFASARGQTEFRITEVVETTQCSPEVAEALRRLSALLHSEPTATLSEAGDLTLVAKSGSRAEFHPLTLPE